MAESTTGLRSITFTLASVIAASIAAVVLTMPTLFLGFVAVSAFLPAALAVVRRSRAFLIAADFILVAALFASHLQGVQPSATLASVDIVRLVLIVSFHEYSSMLNEIRDLEADYVEAESPDVELPRTSSMRNAFVQRGVRVGALLVASAIISEIFLVAAHGASASLYSIYGVAAGLIVLMIFLFLLFSPKAQRPSGTAELTS